jgi:hypothetical protein
MRHYVMMYDRENERERALCMDGSVVPFRIRLREGPIDGTQLWYDGSEWKLTV